MKIVPVFGILLTILLFAGAASAADNFDTWKGDNSRSGYVSENGPLTDAILWNNTYLPSGSSGMYPGVDASPVAADGCVYFSVWGDTKNQVNGVYCADAYTGEIKWRYAATTRGSFSLSDGVLYLGTIGGVLLALDAKTGEKLWVTGQLAEYSYVGLSGAPLVSDGVVYVTGTTYKSSVYTSYLYAFTAETGKSYMDPISLNSEDGDAGIGKFASLSSDADGSILYAAGCGGIAAYDVIHERFLWKFDAGARSSAGVWASTPVFSDGKLYLVITPTSGNSILYCVNAATGKEEWNCSNEYIGSSSPAVTDDSVVVTGKSGLAVFDKSGQLKLRYATGATGFASPVVAGSIAYFGTAAEGTLYAVNVSSGELVWRYTMPRVIPSYYAMIEAAPAVYDGIVFVGAENCVMYAFGILPDVNETKNTVTDGTWSALTKAEVVYEGKPKAFSGFAVPLITHAGHSIHLGAADGDSVVVQKSVEGIWTDVTAYVSEENTLLITGDISDAVKLKASFTGRKLGDVTCDGYIRGSDAVCIARDIVGFVPLNSTEAFYADVNSDGNVSGSDALLIAKYAVGLVNEFYS